MAHKPVTIGDIAAMTLAEREAFLAAHLEQERKWAEENPRKAPTPAPSLTRSSPIPAMPAFFPPPRRVKT